jgi:hypothetical protein
MASKDDWKEMKEQGADGDETWEDMEKFKEKGVIP